MKFVDKFKKKSIDAEYVIRKHHILMLQYGWIPFEEYKKLPISTVNNLLEQINKDFEAKEKATEKMRGKYGRK
jgi:hypothetical protein